MGQAEISATAALVGRALLTQYPTEHVEMLLERGGDLRLEQDPVDDDFVLVLIDGRAAARISREAIKAVAGDVS